MKRFSCILVALVLLQCGGAFAQSDFTVIDTYKKKHQSLEESIKAAQDLGQCESLAGEVSALESDYREHRELLGEALHPTNFDGSIGTLREQLNKSTERISADIEHKKDKQTIDTYTREARKTGQTVEQYMEERKNYQASLEKLSQEVQVLNGRIQVLSDENAGLLGQIQSLQQESRKDKASIAQLKALTEKLTSNIRDRDDLIIRMMDNLVGEYSKAGLTDAQRKNLFVNAQGNDYVGKIIATVDENVKYAENTLLAPQDAELIRNEQRKLSSKWADIKPFVGKLYPDEQTRTRDLATVDDRLSAWKNNVDAAMWKSIYQVFVSQNIGVGSFRTANEFETRLLAYVDEQARNPSRESYKIFKSRAWDSPIKDQWLPVIPTEELTAKQRTDIEERINLWGEKIAALLWRWVLIGILGLAVIVVIAVLFLRKKKPMPPTDVETTGSIKYPTN